jgi:ankyrin repeat protein
MIARCLISVSAICAVMLLALVSPVHAQRGDARDLRVLDAVKRRDEKTFAVLLRSKADINAAQPDGATALAWAVYLGERGMAEALLEAGAKANTTDEYGETPVTLAAANGDAALMQRLLAAGANARAARWNGETAVMIAAGAGNLETVRQLVLHGADVNVADPLRAQTPLMWAAAEAHREVVAGLVEMGANVNAVSTSGFTPLVFAIASKDVPSIKVLLKAGANPNITLASGNTPLIVAMSYHSTDAALTLVEGGADVTVRDRNGNSTLHLAAQAGDPALVKTLLAKGIDPNVRTPAKVAVGRRGGAAGRGATGDVTPLILAARGDHEEAMRALVAAGADPLLRAQDGTSVLMAAAAGARLSTLKYAYELDPHTDVATISGNTPIHLAVEANGRTEPEQCEIIQFLADHGARVDEKNGKGETPIPLADGPGFDVVVKLLAKLIAERGEVPKIPPKYKQP